MVLCRVCRSGLFALGQLMNCVSMLSTDGLFFAGGGCGDASLQDSEWYGQSLRPSNSPDASTRITRLNDEFIKLA